MVNELSSPKKYQGGDTALKRQNTRKLADIAKKNKAGLGEDPILLGSYGPPSGNYGTASALRYPYKTDINANSDYVLFEFKKYKPPFQSQVRKIAQDDGTLVQKDQHGQYDYNRTGEYEDAEPDYKTIIMYMPEDVSTGFRGKWGGKAFSTFGANLLRSAGADGIEKVNATITTVAKQFYKSFKQAANKCKTL